ncbi:hypothetical protein ANAEL_00781 [Anaerolineales bacterium]|nr:hypothetical protein ANAEL_00781 [Anaerolineales bacterium]
MEYTKNIYEALYYIEKHFSFLYNLGFQIVNQHFYNESFGNWIVIFQSQKCILRFIQDRRDIHIEVGPPSSSTELIVRENFTDLNQLVDYIKKKDFNILSSNTSTDVDVQLERLSTLLSSVYNEIIEFINNDSFLQEKAKMRQLFFEKLKKQYPNMKFADTINSNKEKPL